MDSYTRQCIKGFLEGFIQGIINKKTVSGFDPRQLRPMRQASGKGDLKPFHESLLPDGLLRVAEFERSFSTGLGKAFEECARLIALDHHKDAKREYQVEGKISAQAVRRIEQIASDVGSGGMKSGYLGYVQEIVDIAGNGTNVERSHRADLYIEKADGTELYFEIKSPKPNKGQCQEIASRLLQIHGITHEKYPRVKAYIAFAYNPWGIDRSTYKHGPALSYLDLEDQVLIGKEFWELVGGVGTYEEVLEIFLEVGREKGPDMLDQLALGY